MARFELALSISHGGATWKGGVNRDQVSRGAEIMGKVVPVVIHLVMNDHRLN